MTKSMDSLFSARCRFLALDYGQKQAGISIFYRGEDLYPVPMATITVYSDEQLIADVLNVVKKEDIDVLILGVPLMLDGKETTNTKRIRAFGEKCRKEAPASLQFFEQDETLSSFEALSRLEKGGKVKMKGKKPKGLDEVAATIILEDFLKQHGIL